jgi:CBS domain containing-hemolysin-like protein
MAEVLFNTFVVMFFVALNGFFVAAEFAIVKVRHTQIEPLVKRGDLRARVALEIVHHLDAYLSATQLGITMTSLALGWLGEPFVAKMLEPVFAGFGIENPQIVEGVSFGVAFTIITFLHIVLGELAPKSLAIQKAQATTLFISTPLKLFYTIFRPIIWSLNNLANYLIKFVGIRPASESELTHSEEELRLILSEGTEEATVSRAIALNAMDFKRKQARHIMVPRKEMSVLSANAPASVNLELMQKSKFSRYPVYKGTIDNITGIIHTKDIFKHNRHLDPQFSLDAVYRDALFVPETASLETVLETILQKKKHMVILVDEYGGTAGLLTLENILEEIVGNIQDEFDHEAPPVVRISDDEFIVDGSWTTNDVERLLDQELSIKDILSIGGFVVEHLGHIPQTGESFRVNDTEFVVEKVENNVVETVRIKRMPPLVSEPAE